MFPTHRQVLCTLVLLCILTGCASKVDRDAPVANVSVLPATGIATRTFAFDDLRLLRRDRGIDVTTEAPAVALVPFTLLWDETGKAETGVLHQPLTQRLWARKEFHVDRPQARWAQVYFIQGSENTRITLNGRRLKAGSAKEWAYGNWGVVDVPVDALRAGVNAFTFAGEGLLYVENNRWPNRSARSVDAGQTWDYDHLGSEGQYDGEYIVRLGLGQYPSRGMLWSDGIDLWRLGDSADAIAVPAKVRWVSLSAVAETPEGTAIDLEFRSGTSPEYDPDRWHAWRPVPPSGRVSVPQQHRFGQWRATLSARDPLRTPRLRAVTMRARLDRQTRRTPSDVQLVTMDQPQIIRGSYPFYDQKPTKRLSILRQKYQLDQVIAGKTTDLEKFVALRAWTRAQWKNGWENGEYEWATPLDALLILDLAGRGKAAAFCGHYGAVFVQAALSLGYNARIVNARAHAYAEIWSNEHRKWVLMDVGPDTNDQTQLNYHYMAGGIPLHSLDMHRRLVERPGGNWEGVEVVTATPQTAWRIPDHPEAMQRYQYVLIPFRNNHLDSLIPGDLDERGWPTDTGWLAWRDGPISQFRRDEPFNTDRDGDLYWTLNQVAIYPAWSPRDHVIRLTLDTHTPNLQTYQVRIQGGEWRDCGSVFDWELHPGRNRIEVRTVNAFGLGGIVSAMAVERRLAE